MIFGPISILSIHFRCYDIRDFTLIRVDNPHTLKLLSSEEYEEKIKESRGIAGIRLASCVFPKTSWLNYSGEFEAGYDSKYSKEVFKHEERHIINVFFLRKTEETNDLDVFDELDRRT